MGTTFQNAPEFSTDGLSYWDGTGWRSLLSEDGRYKWDGREWILLDLSDILAVARSDHPASNGPAEVASPSVVRVVKPAAASRRVMTTVGALIVLLILSTAAVALLSPNLGKSGSKSPAGPSDSNRVAYLILTPLEVGSNWTLAPAAADTPDRLRADSCLLRYPAYTAGSTATYGFVPDASGKGQVYVSTSGRATATATAAGQVEQAIRTGVDDSCLAASFADYAWNCGCRGGAIAVGKPVLTHPQGPVLVAGKAVDGVEVNGEVPFETPTGHWSLYIDLLRLRRGRIVASLVFTSTDQRTTWAPLELRLAALAEQRLTTASG
jgi:hypothetical protein